MNLPEILKKLGLEARYYSFFEKAFIMPAVYDAKTNTVFITIKTTAVLPADVYTMLCEKFAGYLKKNIQLHIQPADETVETGELINYLRLYASQSNDQAIGKIMPQQDENAIYIDSVGQPALEKIAAFLQKVGIKKPLKNQSLEIAAAPAHSVKPAAAFYPTGTNQNSKSVFDYNYNNENIDKKKYLKMPMAQLHKKAAKIYCSGTVFNVEYNATKKNREIQHIYFSDNSDALIIKRFENRSLPNDKLHEIKPGQYITAYGSCDYDDFDRDYIMTPDFIEIMEQDPNKRQDSYQGPKRLEMHAHTNRSEMDGICSCEDIINQAYNWGWEGVAIVDNAVVQAYPNSQNALLQIDRKDPGNKFKVIFGIEISMVDEQLAIVFNPTEAKLSASEYAVIDLETTGLSARYDSIIEFGGAIVSQGRIVKTKQLFIAAGQPVPPFITKKCGITDGMLADAAPFDQAAAEILDFIGSRVIVAHNAAFDFTFLNEKLKESGRPVLTNPCIDTLNLAKQIIPDRKFYRLGLIANEYGVEYDEEAAHRGDYDAKVLAEIFIRMAKDIPDYANITLQQLQDNQDADIYKKDRPSHVTIYARNMAGIKEIYELVSLSHTKYLTYFAKKNAVKTDSDVVAEPRITRREIEQRHKAGNILIGAGNIFSEIFELAANRTQPQLEKAMAFYDFIEVQPVTNYTPLMEEGSSFDQDRIKKIIANVVETAEKAGKYIIADNDSYYINPNQKIGRDVYIMAKRIGGFRHPLYPLNRSRRLSFKSPRQHMMTTAEMLDEFAFLGEKIATKIVIDQPRALAGQIEKIYPIVQQLLCPEIEGSDKMLTDIIYQNARQIYGDPLPQIVSDRISKELDAVISNGRTVQYYIAYLLVKQANQDGFIVGSRGSVGSSFIATMAKITEVNPLVPHYVCPQCHHSEFITDGSVADGFDLPDKKCPQCQTLMIADGHDIPFETFMGFGGDKVPDIDLNFPSEYQEKAQLMICDLFGNDYSFRAGTIGEVATKTAYGYIKGYCEEMERAPFSKAYTDYLCKMCENVKRTTGQHPAGIVVIPKTKEIHDFTPIQYPANNPFSNWKTTHFAIADLHDNILKLDILGHVDPSAVKMLQTYTGIDPRSIILHDEKTLALFSGIDSLKISDPHHHYHETTGAAGLPEFGTHNIRRILDATKPTSFADLVTLSGLTHGTNVWQNNAEELINQKICTLREVIGCRDDIMRYLRLKGLEARQAFDIMESVRKGRGLKPDWIAEMKKHDVPDWYIDSCLKIQYMFPKAHAVAYVTMAVRIAWYKVYYPAQYYAVFFSLRCDSYELATMLAGEEAVYQRLSDIQSRLHENGKITSKEKDLEPVLEVTEEMYLRGYHLNRLSITKSQATAFIVDPDDPKGILPSFTAIDGLGASVGNYIVSARQEREFISIADFKKRGHVSDTQMELMRNLHTFDGLDDEDQMSLVF